MKLDINHFMVPFPDEKQNKKQQQQNKKKKLTEQNLFGHIWYPCNTSYL